ncbi:MAG: AraC family transcriptional regulator [Tissierellia bacterium]|nr:AraC family transcriptional regulator [Tissierellia bacterium]
MSNKNKKGLCYTLWGDPVYFDGNKYIFEMNPKYGEGKSISINSEMGIYPTLTEHRFNFKVKNPNIPFYENNIFYIGKVLKRNILFKREDNMSILFKEGDVFCFTGNFMLNGEYRNKDGKAQYVGVFAHCKDIINIFEKRNWSTKYIQNIFNNKDFKNGSLISKTYKLDEDLNLLQKAIEDDDRFKAFILSVNIFNDFINNFSNGLYKKSKAYSEKQVETVIKIRQFLDDNLDKYYTMSEIAKIFNMSLSRLKSIFMEYYNTTPYRYHLNARLEKADYLIKNTDMKITAISESLGFSSYDNFFKAYKNKYLCNPSDHRNNLI